MRWGGALLLGVGVLGAFVWACTGDDPATPSEDNDASVQPPPSGSDASVVEDAGSPADVVVDAWNGRCNPNAPFGKPEPVRNITDAGLNEEGARLSPDELTIYFSIGNKALTGWRIFRATRPTRDADFGVPSEVVGINSELAQRFPAATPDGSKIYAAISNVSPNSKFNLAVATRSMDGGYTGFTATPLVNQNNPNTEEMHPFLVPDQSAIYYASTRRSGNYDIYRADAVDGGFGTAVRVDGLTTDSHDGNPVLTSNELAIYFASTRLEGNGWDIYVARRTNKSEGFGTATNLTSANSLGIDQPTSITDDECMLYLTRFVGNVGRIMVAKRGGALN